MIPAIAIVGRSNSGKTSLLEGLVSRLKLRGYRIAAVKHSAGGFELDIEGKDSWRLARAGSDAVLLSSPQQVALFKRLDRELEMEELGLLLGDDYDLILIEGYKKGPATKIEVHRREQGPGLVCSPSELLAVVSDEPLGLSIPQFSPEDVDGVAGLIEQTFLAREGGEVVDLFINGRALHINPFIQEIMSKTMLGMVSTLKGIGEVKSLAFRLRRRGQP